MTNAQRRRMDLAVTPLLFIAAMSATLLWAGAARAAGIILQLPYSTVIEHVRVSGDRVVWSDSRSGSKDVFLYDLATGAQRAISAGTWDESWPQIWGDRVAWSDTRDGTNQAYLYDLSTGAEVRVSTAPTQGQISMWGDWVAFIQGGRPMLHRISTGELFSLKQEGVELDAFPVLGDGWLVVRRDWYGGLPSGDLLAYELSSCSDPSACNPRNLTHGAIGDDFEYPSSVYGNSLVTRRLVQSAGAFQGDRIMLYDLVSGATSVLAGEGYVTNLLDPAIWRNKVLYLNQPWYFPGTEYADVRMYDLDANTDEPLWHGNSLLRSLDVDEGKIVWIGPDFCIAMHDLLVPIARITGEGSVHPGTTVTVSGSTSYDPMENYPLAYAWTLEPRPWGTEPSLSTLSDPAAVTPSFVPDQDGVYVLTLVVTNSLGRESEPAQFGVNTWNNTPVVNAGRDMLLTAVPSLVTLQGAGFDPDGDAVSFEWTLTVPPGSTATLSDPTSPTTTFTADVVGKYWALLKVTDEWGDSGYDQTQIGFDLPPVANAGNDQVVLVGDQVIVDGSASYDPMREYLSFSWRFVSTPTGSQAALSPYWNVGDKDPAPTPDPKSWPAVTFTADLAGTYVVGLGVSNRRQSAQTSVSILAVTPEQQVVREVTDLTEEISKLDPKVLSNPNLANPLTAKLAAIVKLVEAGDYAQALDKLENDVLRKTDGCAASGAPDRNDWVKDCATQLQLTTSILDMITLLQRL